MPLPKKYRKIIDAFYAGRLTGKDLMAAVEQIDSAQRSFEFNKRADALEGGRYVDVSDRFVHGVCGGIFYRSDIGGRK